MRMLRVSLAIGGALLVADCARSAPAPPDLSGLWMRKDVVPGVWRNGFNMEDPPLQPWAMEIYRQRRGGVPMDANTAPPDKLDPMTYCYPPGVPRVMLLNVNTPMEIVQGPKQIHVLFERHPLARRIYMDGRGHPDGFPDSYMGHSIGTWEGDTLVVDTVALPASTWVDRAGTPHSEALHVVERFRRVDAATLEVDFQFEDPKAFTGPWGGKKYYRFTPDAEVLEYVPCEEHLQMGELPFTRSEGS